MKEGREVTSLFSHPSFRFRGSGEQARKLASCHIDVYYAHAAAPTSGVKKKRTTTSRPGGARHSRGGASRRSTRVLGPRHLNDGRGPPEKEGQEKASSPAPAEGKTSWCMHSVEAAHLCRHGATEEEAAGVFGRNAALAPASDAARLRRKAVIDVMIHPEDACPFEDLAARLLMLTRRTEEGGADGGENISEAETFVVMMFEMIAS